MDALICTEKLNRIFRTSHNELYALKNVDLYVNPGTLTILKGRSGSGKTTLLDLLGALDSPTSGKIIFDSNELTAMPEPKRGG